MQHTESLTLNKEFGRLYRKGRSIVSPFVVVYFLKNRQQKNRIGITTSKKIGNAVCRNRARRVIREAYRLLEPQLPVGYDFVFVARYKTVHCSMWDIYRVLEKEFL